jgi:hypothetical protein
MSERENKSRINAADLPLPVALNPGCVNLPLGSPHQVLTALDSLAKDFNTVLSKEADAKQAGMIIGGGAGVAMGFGPGGLLFGPIGAAIGGTLGIVLGGVVGSLLPAFFKNKINPAEAAREAIQNGAYEVAETHLAEIVKRTDAPGLFDAITKFVGAKVNGTPAELGAMYRAALAVIQHVRGHNDAASATLREALGRVKHNLVLLDLLASFGEAIDDALLDGIEQVDDEVMKIAFLERYAQRHLDEPWVIVMLSQAYRRRFRPQSAGLDRVIAEKQADLGWMLEIARLAQSRDQADASAAQELMARLPNMAAEAKRLIERADEGLAPLKPDSNALNGGEREAAETRGALEATRCAIDEVNAARVKAEKKLEELRSSTATAAERALKAQVELGRIRAELSDAQRALREAQSRAPGSPSVAERSSVVRDLEARVIRQERSLQEAEASEKRLAADKGAMQQQIDKLNADSAEKGRQLQVAAKKLERREIENEQLRQRLGSFIDDFLCAAPADCDARFRDDLIDVYRTNPEIARRAVRLVLAEQSGLKLKPVRGCSGVGENHIDDGPVAYRAYASLSYSPRRRWLRMTKKEHQNRTIEQLKRAM